MIIKYIYISRLNEGHGHLRGTRDASQIANLFTKPTPKHLFLRRDSSYPDSTRKAMP